jgi:hypothetical protein
MQKKSLSISQSIKAQKAANMRPFKHCSFIVTVRGENRGTNIPLTDLVCEGDDAGDGRGPGFPAMDELVIVKLHSVLEKQKLFEPRCLLNELIYKDINDFETRITSDTDLREAARSLQTPGSFELALEIVKLVRSPI